MTKETQKNTMDPIRVLDEYAFVIKFFQCRVPKFIPAKAASGSEMVMIRTGIMNNPLLPNQADENQARRIPAKKSGLPRVFRLTL